LPTPASLGCSLHGLGSLPVLCFESFPFSRTFCFEGR
jgi:hypothetical protein